jgi:UDP-N-acetylmuramoylalanine-D-glutamate ligase
LNLTPEHLNYHGSVDKYVALERAYLAQQSSSLNCFVAGIDDERVRDILAAAPQDLKAKALTFGCTAEADIGLKMSDTRNATPDSPLFGQKAISNWSVHCSENSTSRMSLRP